MVMHFGLLIRIARRHRSDRAGFLVALGILPLDRARRRRAVLRVHFVIHKRLRRGEQLAQPAK